MESIIFVNNTNLHKSGGGFHIEYSENLTISEIQFYKNKASRGGGFAVIKIYYIHFKIFKIYYY